MIVEGTWRRAIELHGTDVVVLDQTALPHAVRWVTLLPCDYVAWYRLPDGN